MTADSAHNADAYGSDANMEERIKECSRVTIECDMQIFPPNGAEPIAQRQCCSFVMGVDPQYASLETALMNKKTGDRLKVHIPPEEMFGAYDEELVRDLPREDYKQERLQAGRMYRQIKKKTLVQFMVKELYEDKIVADFNDDRAGTWAECDILVTEVREARKDEMKPSCAKLPEC